MNTQNQKLFYLSTQKLMLIAFLTLSVGCQNKAGSYVSDSQENTNGEAGDTTGLSGLAVKNFEQIYTSMASLTNIDPNTYANNIKTYYEANKLALPQDNSVANLQPGHLVTISNLAAEFCYGLFEDFGCGYATNCTSRVRTFFNGTTFSNLNSQSRLFTTLNSPSQKLEISKHFLNKFWGVEIQESIARRQAEDDLVVLIADLMEGYSTTNGGTFGDLKKVLEGVCSATLSSGPVIYF